VSGGPSNRVDRALGIDVGSVRVGLAASDPSGTIASPVTVLARTGKRALWGRLRDEAAGRGATLVVVGLPRRLDGSEGDAARDAREFAAEAERELGLPCVLWDERLTTVQAERSLIAAGKRRSARRASIDSVAASLLLQSWLDSRRAR
jgi:putative holliday junction resolvase